MRTRRSLHTIIIALLVLVFGQTWGSEKEWVTLTDCQYVDSKDNDGDGFRVRCGDKEFRARLYGSILWTRPKSLLPTPNARVSRAYILASPSMRR